MKCQNKIDHDIRVSWWYDPFSRSQLHKQQRGGIDSNGCCGSAKVQHSTFVKNPVIICSICISNSANRAEKVRVHTRLFETFRDLETSMQGIYIMFETSRPQNMWVQVHPLHPLVCRPCAFHCRYNAIKKRVFLLNWYIICIVLYYKDVHIKFKYCKKK